MKLAILLSAFVISLLVIYQPREQKGYTASERHQLDRLIEQTQQPRPVILRRETTMLAELYPDYANDRNPKALPQDWNYKGKRR